MHKQSYDIRKVEVIIDIDTTPDRIIHAFVDQDMLHDWWDVERALIEKMNEGAYTLAWSITDKGFGYISSGIIKEYHPENILRIENLIYMNPEKTILGPMSLTIKATKKGAGAELYLCQDGYQNGGDWDWYYNAVKEAWPIVTKTLKDYLEKK